MKQIRRGVFETNSSSTHTLTMCSGTEFEKFENGELWYDKYSEELVSLEQIQQKHPEVTSAEDVADVDYYRYQTWEDFGGDCYEVFHDTFTTESGEVIHAFGYFGYDG